jgi:hypothetical protein
MAPAADLSQDRGIKANGPVRVLNEIPAGAVSFKERHMKRFLTSARADHDHKPQVGAFSDNIDAFRLKHIRDLFHTNSLERSRPA